MVRERTTAIIPSPQQSDFICTGSFSHVQLTMRPLERQTSADTMIDISDELPPKTPEDGFIIRE
jgi:hypothetical protein